MVPLIAYLLVAAALFCIGVYTVLSRRNAVAILMGVDLMPSMGMATAMNFQASGPGKTAATGDFVMIGEEVNPVAKALRDQPRGNGSLAV